jgi:hypothetical protein
MLVMSESLLLVTDMGASGRGNERVADGEPELYDVRRLAVFCRAISSRVAKGLSHNGWRCQVRPHSP